MKLYGPFGWGPTGWGCASQSLKVYGTNILFLRMGGGQILREFLQSFCRGKKSNTWKGNKEKYATILMDVTMLH